MSVIRVVYADTSALVKLVVAEAETPALRAWIRSAKPTLVTSDLTRTELIRAVRRNSPDRVTEAGHVLAAIRVLTLSSSIFIAAARLESADLRSLDAIHITSALEFGDDLIGILTYDERMARAVKGHGVDLIAPGR